MLFDDVTITVSAGHGGKGAVAFNTNLMSLGPAGGSGGLGGSVFVEGVSDLSALNNFRYQKVHRAQDGRDGRPQFKDGHDGENITLKVPVGTVIHFLTKRSHTEAGTHEIREGEEREIVRVGERILAVQGGRGGKGNFQFRSSTNTSPTKFQEGVVGESATLRLELKLIADVGFIGLPNAGKSSLLNELTSAKSKVANYPFTTLEPNLGAYYELLIADIPGLIEGASSGKGLGIKFLRHVERTNVLFHLVSAESPHIMQDYKVIRKEIGTYNKTLLKKQEYIFLSKTDMVDAKEVKKKITALKKVNPRTQAISIHDWDSLEKVKKILNKLKDKKLSGKAK
jgi:GTP-binding protein